MMYLLFLLLPISFAQTLEDSKVTDVASLEACYEIHPYALGKKQKSESMTAEWVGKDKIMLECNKRAVILAKTRQKESKAIEEIAGAVARQQNPQSTLTVYQVMVSADLKTCDSMEMYKALKEGLSRPAGDFFVNAANGILDICIKDKQFAADIKEEIESDNKYLVSNLCTYLKKNKIANNCK